MFFLEYPLITISKGPISLHVELLLMLMDLQPFCWTLAALKFHDPIHTNSVGLHGRSIGPSQSLYLDFGQLKK
jgi:hypothetical protein